MGRIEGQPRIPMSKKILKTDGTVKEVSVFQFTESQTYDSAQTFLRLFKNELTIFYGFQSELQKVNPQISPKEYFQMEKNGKGKAPVVKFNRGDNEFEVSYTGRGVNECLSIKRIYEDTSYDIVSIFAGKPEYDRDKAVNEGQITWSSPVTKLDHSGKLKIARIDYYYNDMEARSAVNSVLSQIQGQAS